MLKQCLALICLSFFSLSVAQAGYLPPPGDPFPSAESPFNPNGPVTKQLGYFTGIVLSGNIDVDIITNSPSSQVVLTGDMEAIKQIQVIEKNDTVTINQAPQWFVSNKGPAKVHAEIYTRYLNDLTLKNYTGHLQAKNLDAPYLNLDLNHSGTVFLSGKLGINRLSVSGSGVNQIQGIDSDFLSIQMSGNPSVDLSGVVNLQTLDATGNGRLRLYWVDSNKLQVRQAGSTSVELAGVVNHLMLHLQDSAYFNGRYLRTIVGYAKTYDKSVADVQFLKSQAVLANDDSTISFYGKPPYKADFMGRNGAVLDMHDH